MSSNKLRGYEEVNVNGVVYLFRGNFEFLATLKEVSENSIFEITDLVPNGDPEAIRDVLICSLEKIASAELILTDDEKRNLIEDFITDYGLEQCLMLANLILSYALLGDLKKNEMARHQDVNNLLNSLLISRSRIFRNHAWLWAYVAMISGLSVCASIKIYGMFIVPS